MKKLFFLIIFLSLQSCFLNEAPIVEQRELFKETKDQEFKFLNQDVLETSTKDSASSIISEVAVSSNLVKKSFEQLLVFSKQEFKFAWYAPNYLQILSTLVGDEKSWLFCDFIGRSCFNDFSNGDDFSFLESFLDIKGFSVPGLFLGIATNYRGVSDFQLTSGPDDQYILSYGQDGLIFEFLLFGKSKSKIVTEKLFISEEGKRLLEIFYFYDENNSSNLKIPKEVEIRIIEQNVNFKFKLKKFNHSSIKNQANAFTHSLPNGFKMK